MRNQHNTPDEKVEHYFRRLNWQLFGIPKSKKAEIEQEINQHFRDLVSAHEELGASNKDAIDASLRQLGDPMQLGAELHRQWFLSLPRSAHDLSVLFWAFSAYSWTLLIVDVIIAITLINDPHRYIRQLETLSHVAMFIPPILGGIVIGWLYPKRASRIVMCVIALWAYFVWSGCLGDLMVLHAYWNDLASPVSAVAMWLISGLVAARIGYAVRVHLGRRISSISFDQ